MNIFGEEIPDNDFSTAKKYEKHLEYLLKERNNLVTSQTFIGYKPSGNKHICDMLVNGKIIVSAKLQNTAGTAEEKVPYEQHMLQIACEKYGYEKAYIVCQGDGWTQLDYYISKEYNDRINTPNVCVIKYNDFVKLNIL